MLNRRRFIQTFASLPMMGGLLASSLSTSAQAAAGRALSLEQYQGKVVLADFWASWCGPCRLSMPWLNQMHEKYAAHGLHVLGVNLDEDAASAAKFLADYPATFEVVYDPQGQYASHYGLQTMPTSILFDRQGNKISHHNGFLSDKTAEYEARLVAALNA